MNISSKNTNISWITVPKQSESEWSTYQKSFVLDKKTENATVRFECNCTCALYVNGEFITSGTGRYPERVYYYEITPWLHEGENTLLLMLGDHYFQPFGLDVTQKRTYSFNQFALEFTAAFSDGTSLVIPTDSSWVCTDGGKEQYVTESAQVTKTEYSRFWENAALWKDVKYYKPKIPDAVLSVVGKEYLDYANKKAPTLIPFDKVVETNMEYSDGSYINKNNADECYIILDFGQPIIGYGELEYTARKDVTFNAKFDYSETVSDFYDNPETKYYIDRCQITETLSADKSFYRNHRRRAYRYTKMTFTGDVKDFTIHSFKIRQSLFPETEKGYFSCSDEMLNKIWEHGKYTLHINKQQEYESCPRNEMLFFAGDGAIDALIDMYAFGNCDMLKTSLSLDHTRNAAGIAPTAAFNRSVWQWDYIAWRVVCIYNYYSYTGDGEFLKLHYSDAVKNIHWLIERMNNNSLLYQTPAFISTSGTGMAQVDWACSLHRIGENVFLNCLLYKALDCISRLANEMGDTENSHSWETLAKTVREKINERLWSDEKKAYLDGMSDNVAQDANTFAVLFGVADSERADIALETMKQRLWSPYGSTMLDAYLENKDLRGGNTMISPMMSAFECEARFIHDRAEEGIELIRRVWGTMLEKGATTFWEFTPNDNVSRWPAPCHAWSAGCTYLLSAYVLGIRQTSPKWSSIVFAPRPCDLKYGKGVVVTPSGIIAASWVTDENGVKTFKLAVPKNVECTTSLPDGAKIELIKY